MNPRQKKFIEEYLIDLNATAAARRAGYAENGIRVTGHRLLTDPNIAAAIAKRQKKLQAETEITQEWVLKRLRENQAKAVELDQITASNRALELLGKHLGLFDDVVKHKADESFADVFKSIASVSTSLPRPTNGAPRPNGAGADN